MQINVFKTASIILTIAMLTLHELTRVLDMKSQWWKKKVTVQRAANHTKPSGKKFSKLA